MSYNVNASREEISLSPTCQLRQGGKNDEVIQQIKEITMKCEIHPNIDLIPTIFRCPNKKDIDFKKRWGFIKFRGKEGSTYIQHACPNCTQAHWQSIHEEWGTYFISE